MNAKVLLLAIVLALVSAQDQKREENPNYNEMFGFEDDLDFMQGSSSNLRGSSNLVYSYPPSNFNELDFEDLFDLSPEERLSITEARQVDYDNRQSVNSGVFPIINYSSNWPFEDFLDEGLFPELVEEQEKEVREEIKEDEEPKHRRLEEEKENNSNSNYDPMDLMWPFMDPSMNYPQGMLPSNTQNIQYSQPLPQNNSSLINYDSSANFDPMDMMWPFMDPSMNYPQGMLPSNTQNIQYSQPLPQNNSSMINYDYSNFDPMDMMWPFMDPSMQIPSASKESVDRPETNEEEKKEEKEDKGRGLTEQTSGNLRARRFLAPKSSSLTEENGLRVLMEN